MGGGGVAFLHGDINVTFYKPTIFVGLNAKLKCLHLFFFYVPDTFFVFPTTVVFPPLFFVYNSPFRKVD